MVADTALEELFVAKLCLEALGMEEVALALAHLHDIYLLHETLLLVLECLDCGLVHFLDTLV